MPRFMNVAIPYLSEIFDEELMLLSELIVEFFW